LPESARVARSVPALRALAWYAESMRLWKRGPATFAGLAFVTLVASIAFEPVPVVGFLMANVLAPLLATGMLYASLAADRGEGPRMKHALAPFAAPPGAQAAVVLAGLATFGAEALTASQLADANLFLPAREAMNLPLSVVVPIYIAGIVASLPLTFVPFAALFDGDPLRDVRVLQDAQRLWLIMKNGVLHKLAPALSR